MIRNREMLFSRFRLTEHKLRNMEMKSYNRLRTTLAVMAAGFLCLTCIRGRRHIPRKTGKGGFVWPRLSVRGKRDRDSWR